MRILIISNSRCGSTNLMKSISSAYGIPHVFEPFLFNTEFDINKPLVIKTLINQNTLDRLHFIELQEDIWFYCLDTLKWSTYKTICKKD